MLAARVGGGWRLLGLAAAHGPRFYTGYAPDRGQELGPPRRSQQFRRSRLPDLSDTPPGSGSAAWVGGDGRETADRQPTGTCATSRARRGAHSPQLTARPVSDFSGRVP